MNHAISLTPGFSPVAPGHTLQNRFNGFPRAGKPLKRLACLRAFTTPLKPGVNESDENVIHFCKHGCWAALPQQSVTHQSINFGAYALRYNFVRTNSRCPSASAAVKRPLAVCTITSINLSPASSTVISPRKMAHTSRSMCSLIVEQVIGFPESLMTGSMGLPMTLPWPVGNKCTTAPDAAHKVTASAAADEVSMNQSPLLLGASAGLRQPTNLVFLPSFSMLPNAFSSMVVSPPRMLPFVGCDSERSSIFSFRMKSL